MKPVLTARLSAAGDLRRFTILHTIETGGPGGAETVLLELASRLDSRRFRSVALLPGGNWLPGELQTRGIPTVIARSTAWYDPTLIRRMAGVVRRERVDLIHSHLADQNFHACVVGQLTRRRTVVTYHGALHLSGRDGFRRTVKNWVVRHSADRIVVVSDYLRRQFERAGFPPAKMARIYNGIDEGRFADGVAANLRRELDLPPDVRLVGMVANLRRPKGYEHFVESARAIAAAVPEAYFLAVGETEAALLAELRALIHQFRLDERFFFLGFRADIPQVLKDLDVFVLSSTDEGLSIATIEAMGASRPVVVTSSGGPEEIIHDGETGFLVPPADPAALAARVIEVLRDPQLGARLGSTARADVEHKFSLARMVAEYESLYTRCLEGK